MEFAKIVLFSVAAAIVYGILHDQVTAHLCVEYFTVAHPPVFHTQSPFLLALGWGVLATWWVGLPLGLLLAAVARVGSVPRLVLADVRPWIIVLLVAMAICALVAGGVGSYLVATGVSPVPGGWAARIPPSKQVAFSADAWAHLASYASGMLGGLILIGYAFFRRMRPRLG
jgi:hypothetical protein